MKRELILLFALTVCLTTGAQGWRTAHDQRAQLGAEQLHLKSPLRLCQERPLDGRLALVEQRRDGQSNIGERPPARTAKHRAQQLHLYRALLLTH